MMRTPRFNVGKLIKLVCWVIVIAVPMTLYYLHYSESLRSYSNQRNYRALNELAGQFGDHFKALEKLFLFAPNRTKHLVNKNAIDGYKRRLQLNDYFKEIKANDVSNKAGSGSAKPYLNNRDILKASCKRLERTVFIVNDNTTKASLTALPCSAIRELDKRNTIYFDIPVGSLLGSALPSEFDGIILSDGRGKVLFQKDLHSLEWSEDSSVLEMSRQGASISNVNWLLREASEKLRAKGDTADDTRKRDAGAKTGSNTRVDIGHSMSVDLDIAGTDYRVYIHPFELPHRILSPGPKAGDYEPLSSFYIVGLVEKKRLGLTLLSIPIGYVVVFLLLLIIGFLAWPFLKLNFMGAKEAISRGDLRILIFSLLFILVITTNFWLSVFLQKGLEQEMDQTGWRIAQEIKNALLWDVETVLKHLKEAKATYEGGDYSNADLTECLTAMGEEIESENQKETFGKEVFSCLPKEPKPWQQEVPKQFPHFRDVFAMDREGNQVGPIIYYVDRLYGSGKLKVGFRDYFKKPRDGKAWHWRQTDVIPFFIERIYNFSDGHKASQIAMPMTVESVAVPQEAIVIASTAYFPSIAAPVLPASFRFAIIDDATGEILYHSQDEKSFVENLFSESDYDPHLIAHTTMRHQGVVDGHNHGKRTRFFLSPLNHIPWTLVVYYDVDRLHLFTAKTAVVGLFLYACYLILLLVTLFVLRKVLIKGWNWLWPDPRKAILYRELVLFLLLFVMGLSLQLNAASGSGLFLSFLICVPLLLVQLWIFIGDSVQPSKRYDYLALGSAFVALALAYFIRKDTLFILWMLAVFAILAARVFLPKPLRHNASTPYCPKSCRRTYLGVVSLVYLSIAVVPTIILYKDAAETHLAIFSRINKLDYSEQIQHRLLVMEKFGKMFYPLDFDKPNNAGNRLTFPGKKEARNKGIYGFKQWEISSSIDGDTDVRGFGCPGQSNKQRDTLALKFIRNLTHNLHFAQQHVINMDEAEGKCWTQDGQTLRFTTNDSAGLVEHSISCKQEDGRFWSLVSAGMEGMKGRQSSTHECSAQSPEPEHGRKFGNDALESQAGKDSNEPWWREPILLPGVLTLVMMIFLWWLILDFFARRLLGILVPEPALHHNTLEHNLEALKRNPRRVIIRASDHDFGQILEDLKAHQYVDDCVADIQYFDALKSPVNEVCPDKSSNKVLVIDNLDASFSGNTRRKDVLVYLEALAEEKCNPERVILIRCEIEPLYRLTNPRAYPYRAGSGDEIPNSETDEIYRWTRLLAQFEKHYYPIASSIGNDNDLANNENLSEQQAELIRLARRECRIWPELAPIGRAAERLIREADAGTITEEHIIEYIGTHAQAIYRKRWELCTRDERLALHQIAAGQFVNPANQQVIEHLHRRVYIKRDPYFQIANRSFMRFIPGAELIENVEEWQSSAAESVWSGLKVPLFIILFCIAGLLIYTATEAVDVTLGLLSALVAFVPILLRGVSSMRGAASETPEPSPEPRT